MTDNELIAEFMGAKPIPVTTLYGGKAIGWQFPNKPSVDYGMMYDTSWDWLMPVVAKIAEYRMAYPKQTAWICDCKIVVYQHILYREVVNFIKWFNKQKTS